MRFIGLFLLEGRDDCPQGMVIFGKLEPFSLRKVTPPTLLAATTLIASYYYNSANDKDKKTVDSLRQRARREWFGGKPLFPKRGIALELGGFVEEYDGDDTQLFADWCHGALCDQNHFLLSD